MLLIFYYLINLNFPEFFFALNKSVAIYFDKLNKIYDHFFKNFKYFTWDICKSINLTRIA